MKKLFIILVILAMAVSIVNADQLKWNASVGATGYTVYWGTETGLYPFNEDVGNVLEIGVAGQDGVLRDHFKLNPGTWNFVVRAYNSIGDSDDSNIANLSIAENVQPEDVFPIQIVVPATTTITITQD